jgi:hypothetical protein
LTIAETATITDNVFARLGAGDNVVNHNGNVGGNIKLFSANANDQFNVGTTAVTGGTTTNKLGQQKTGEHYEGLGGGCSHNTGSNGATCTTTTTTGTTSNSKGTSTAASRSAAIAKLAAVVSRLRR